MSDTTTSEDHMSDTTTSEQLRPKRKRKRTRMPGAVAKVRKLIESLPPDAPRKQLRVECARLGLNWNTARTIWDNLRAQRHRNPQNSRAPLV